MAIRRGQSSRFWGDFGRRIWCVANENRGRESSVALPDPIFATLLRLKAPREELLQKRDVAQNLAERATSEQIRGRITHVQIP